MFTSKSRKKLNNATDWRVTENVKEIVETQNVLPAAWHLWQ